MKFHLPLKFMNFILSKELIKIKLSPYKIFHSRADLSSVSSLSRGIVECLSLLVFKRVYCVPLQSSLSLSPQNGNRPFYNCVLSCLIKLLNNFV